MVQSQSTRSLGSSGLSVSALGLGTNKWQLGKNDEAVFNTFEASLGAGINLFDTAEMYSFGKSEKLLGECIRKSKRQVIIATKYMPMPFRSFQSALDASLARLGVEAINLYYIHFPTGNIEKLMEQMAEAVKEGKIRAVGVSNFSAIQMKRAADRLARYSIPLAANEVQYNLLHRQPEINGVLNACREMNVAMVCYFPLNSGRISKGSGTVISKEDEPKSLKKILQNIASKREKSISQVVLNWLLRR